MVKKCILSSGGVACSDLKKVAFLAVICLYMQKKLRFWQSVDYYFVHLE